METTDNIESARSLLWILKVLGFWYIDPKDEQKNVVLRQMQRYYRYVIHVPFTFVFISLLWGNVFTSQNLTEAGDVLYMSLTEATLIVKIVNLWLLSEKAWRFMNEIADNDLYTLHTDKERQLWRRKHGGLKLVIYGYVGGSLLVWFFGSLGPFLGKKKLPYPIWLPFDLKVGRNFWYAHGYDSIGMLTNCISNVTLDLIYCYFMFHVALLYKLIGMRFVVLQETTEKEVIEKLRKIFELHRNVKRLTTECQSLVSAPVMAQIVLSAFILCFGGFRMLNISIAEQPDVYFAMIEFVAVMILEIFLPCYYANEITINANKITTSVYCADWVHMSVPTRKLLFIYMELLKRPVVIKAGNFFEVGLPIFTRTMNNAYSFFALLLNMNRSGAPADI